MATPATNPAPKPGADGGPPTQQKATTMRFLIAAEESVVEDWKEKRIAAICPMNMPIKPYIEKALKLKLKWEDMDHVTPVMAEGKDLDSIAPTGEPLEMALTPHQLRMKPDSLRWIWLREKADYDQPMKDANEYYLDRLKRFYEFYEPSKVREVENTLKNFDGQEELLFAQLTARYGPEPANQRWRHRMVNARQLAGANGMMLGPGTDFNQLASSMNLAAVMSRTSDNLMLLSYLKKWIQWRGNRKEALRVVAFMTGNMDGQIRKDYYAKWRVFFQTKKMKKQLQASTQMAYKSESLVGDLATENMFLKGEVKRLQSQVEVLDSTNTKRLENLYSSSEAAINQIQLLTRENQEKEELITRLEARLMNVGNLMLQATEEKDATLAETAGARVKLETEVDLLHSKVKMLEEALYGTQHELEELKDKPQLRADDIPEYQQIKQECNAHLANHERLRSRIEELDREKQALRETNNKANAEIRSLQREVSSLKSEVSRSRHFLSDDDVPPPPPPPEEGDANDELMAQPPSVSRVQPQMVPGDTRHVDAVKNVSFAFNQNLSQPSISPNQLKNSLTGALTRNRGGSAPPSEQQTMNESQATIPVPNQERERADMSLDNFFRREEHVSREKMKLALDRHLRPRYGTNPSEKTRSNYTVASPTGQRPQDTVPSAASHLSVADAMALQQMHTQSIAARPKSVPVHATYGVGEYDGSVKDMRSNLFAYK